MTYVIVAVAILVFAGAGIAFLGDRIGSTIGKKRLSILKMRPRDTARVVTLASGSVIALVAFLFLVIADHNFLIALERGTELILTNRHLTNENKRLSESATQTQIQLAQANDASQEAQKQLTSINAQLKTAQASIKTADDSLLSVQKQLVSDKAEVSTLQFQANNLRSENAEAGRRLQKTVGQVLTRDEGTLIYRSQEEVGRDVIAGDNSVADIQRDIRAFLGRLSQTTSDHGGTGVQLVKIGIVTGSSNEQSMEQPPVFASEDENVNALAQSIHDSHAGRVAVIANAYGNAYAGREVVVWLHPYVDRLVLRAGTELAKRTIPENDRTSSLRILSDLQGVLETAKANAADAGMIPLENPQLKEAEIIDVPVAELVQVADQIKQSSGPAVVIVTASKDTYASDHPLAIRFTVDGNEVRLE